MPLVDGSLTFQELPLSKTSLLPLDALVVVFETDDVVLAQ